jgi:hypothetical protein
MTEDTVYVVENDLVRDFFDNDIYLLEVVSDKVVINDNYTGLIVLDSALKTVRRHHIMDEIVFEDSFTWGDGMLLHCIENDCFVYLDMAKASYKMIPLLPELHETPFLAAFAQEGDQVFLLTESGTVGVMVDVAKGTVSLTRCASEDEAFATACDAWEAFRKSSLHKVYPERHLVLADSEDGFEVICYTDGTRKAFMVQRAPFHDLEAFGDYLAQVDEWGIVLTDGNGCLRLAPEPDGYYFCWGRFLPVDGGMAFFTLASNNANCKECRIQRIMLTPDMFTADGCGA